MRHCIYLKRVGRGHESEKKKKLFLNSVHTRPVQGNSEKKPKKFEKIKKKTISGIIFIQNWIR